ncbi:MAG: DUF2254 domain-containing protein, partial [Chloroflexota bacterium]|nr:DUF2254 domain-containing protein [Chloroflexota bacterium]
MSNNGDGSLKDQLLSRIPPWLETWWTETKSTLWFLPTCATVFAVLLSSLVIWLDYYWELTTAGINSPWLFGAGSDGARGVLSA